MIRPMTSKDIEHVQQIAHVTWRETYCGIIPEELQTTFLEHVLLGYDANGMRMEKTGCLLLKVKAFP